MNSLHYRDFKEDMLNAVSALISGCGFSVSSASDTEIILTNNKTSIEIFYEGSALQIHLIIGGDKKFVYDLFDDAGLKERYFECLNMNLPFKERNRVFVNKISTSLCDNFKTIICDPKHNL